MSDYLAANVWPGANPGRMDKRIQIQEATYVQDGHGQPIATWNTVGSVNASFNRVSGGERFSERQIHSDATDLILTRYITGVTSMATTKHRVLFGSRVFDILQVHNIRERGSLLLIEAKEHLDEAQDA